MRGFYYIDEFKRKETTLLNNDMINRDFQNNYREKVYIWISNSGCWYDLQSNKINIITQHEITNLLILISCVKNEFRVL